MAAAEPTPTSTESCGFVSWEATGRPGKIRATCACGWTGAAIWKNGRSYQEAAIEQLRVHVREGWA